MTMKFGGKPTIKDKMATAEKHLGATTGASKGSKPPPAPKIKPNVKRGAIGAKVQWKF